MSEPLYPWHASLPVEQVQVTPNVTPLEALFAELRAWLATRRAA